MGTARVWVYIGDAENPFTVFDFTDSRRRDGPVSFLKNCKGFLQADAFAGYDCFFAGGAVTEVACWAHARRKLFESLNTNSAVATIALKMIKRLYEVERRIAQSTPAQRKEERMRLEALRSAAKTGYLFRAWTVAKQLLSSRA